MNSESRQWATVGVSAFALVVIGGLTGLSGCNPHRDQLRPENVFEQIGRQHGQLIEPRKCVLRVAILDRSFRDPSINEIVWKTADEQAITPEARRALQVNGLRHWPDHRRASPELESVLAAPPPHKVEPATFLLDDGEQTLISINEPVDQVSLLLNRENRPYGKDYQAASGYFRVIADPRRHERCLASLHARDPSRAGAALVPAHRERRPLRSSAIQDQRRPARRVPSRPRRQPRSRIRPGGRGRLPPGTGAQPGRFSVHAGRCPRRPATPEADPGLGRPQPARHTRREGPPRRIAPSLATLRRPAWEPGKTQGQHEQARTILSHQKNAEPADGH